MKRLLIIVLIALMIFSLNAFADYRFLSLESNTAIEQFKEKYRVKEVVSEKEEGLVWAVILPPNSGVKKDEIREAVYNDETGEFEAIYAFTDITITNAEDWTKVVWGSASEFHPYDVPRIHFIFDS
ncbi:MAG: hypothetical protein Q8N73_02700 [bacterium]|nr:hypothetical protein [bacterium]